MFLVAIVSVFQTLDGFGSSERSQDQEENEHFEKNYLEKVEYSDSEERGAGHRTILGLQLNQGSMCNNRHKKNEKL